MGNYKQLSKNTAIFAIGSFSVKIIQFFLMPIVTIAMTAEEYGTAESLVSLTELIIPLCTLGLQDAVFRFVMLPDISAKKVLSTTMAIVAGGFILVCGGAAVAALRMDAKLCLLFAVLYLCVALSNIWGQYVRGSGRVKTFAFSGILQALMLAGTTAVFVYWKHWGAYGYLLSLVAAYLSSLIVLFFAGGTYRAIGLRGFDKALCKKMLRYALPLIPNMLCWWFIQVVNRYIIIYFDGEAGAGLYIATSKIATLINIFGTIFLQAWTIATVKGMNDEDKGEFNTNIFRIYSTFLICAASALMFILPLISGFLLQGEFADSWRYSAIGVFTAIISCYASFFGAYYGAALKTKMVMISTIAGAVVNVVSTVLFVWLWGISGAFFGSLLGYIVLTAIRVVDTQKYSQMSFGWVKEILILLILLAQAVFILQSARFSMGVYYGVQAAFLLVIAALKCKDLIRIVKMILQLLQNRKKYGLETAGTGEGASQDLAENSSDPENSAKENADKDMEYSDAEHGAQREEGDKTEDEQ